MFTERFAIQQRMTEIKEERRALNDEYYKLLDRLHLLDSKATTGDVVAADMSKLVEELSKAVQSVSNLVPKATLKDVVDQIKAENAPLVEQITKEVTGSSEPKLTDTQERIQKEVRRASIAIEAKEKKEDEEVANLFKIKPKQAEPIVLSIMREAGVPLSPSAVYEKLQGEGYEMNTSIHEVIRRLAQEEKVESPSYGFWQPKLA
jgi:hypothetical protein